MIEEHFTSPCPFTGRVVVSRMNRRLRYFIERTAYSPRPGFRPSNPKLTEYCPLPPSRHPPSSRHSTKKHKNFIFYFTHLSSWTIPLSVKLNEWKRCTISWDTEICHRHADSRRPSLLEHVPKRCFKYDKAATVNYTLLDPGRQANTPEKLGCVPNL